MKARFWRRASITLLKLLHLRDSPKRTAAAFAIGLFWGLSPIPPFIGLHTGLVLLCAFVFRLNKIAAYIGIHITNPFTFVPIYMFGTYIGSLVLGYDLNISASAFKHLSLTEVFGGPREAVKAYLVGNCITATVGSVVGYFVTSWAIARYRRLKESRRARLGPGS